MIGRRRGGPGLLGTVARTAVIAGTARATANAVNRRAAPPALAPTPPPQPAPAAAAPGDAGDLVTQLGRLAQLRDSGTLTEAEFQAAKNRILA